MGGVSPVGAGAHGLGLPAASSCRLLFDQLTPLELRPDTHTSFPEAQIMQNTREILSHKRVNGGKKKLSRQLSHVLMATFQMSGKSQLTF